MTAYIGVTAHYVAVRPGAWKLEEDLLGVVKLNGAHTGENMAQVVFELFQEFGIQKKVGRQWSHSDHRLILLYFGS